MMAIQRKYLLLGIGLAACVAAVVAPIYFSIQKPAAQVAPLAMRSAVVDRRFVSREDSSQRALSKSTSMRIDPVPISIRQRMKTAKDWYALAKEILPQAKTGDPEAQYVLFMTNRLCTLGLTDYFKKYDTLEKARQAAMQYDNRPLREVEARFQRCHGFYTDEAITLGDPWHWLQTATDAGYAPAQTQTARERLLQDQSKAFIRAGATPADAVAYLPPIGGDADPRELLAMAVQSADPEVLAEIGSLQHLLNPQQPRDTVHINSAAWMYVACQRGADCSVFGPASLTNCGPNDGQCTPVPERFLAQVNYNWAPVQEKVNEINAALNAKQWDKLGLTPIG
jgi:hypothetical protein